mgnify:CR=1 FL=1
MPQSYPGKYGKTPTAIPSTPMAAAFFTTKGPTIGMANTKRGNHPARMGYVGMLPHRRNRCQLLLFKRPAELEVRGYCTSCRER